MAFILLLLHLQKIIIFTISSLTSNVSKINFLKFIFSMFSEIKSLDCNNFILFFIIQLKRRKKQEGQGAKCLQILFLFHTESKQGPALRRVGKAV